MITKKGFSLLFFMAYLFFFSIVSYSICHVIVNAVIPSIGRIRMYQKRIIAHSATDLFVRDMRINAVREWKMFEPEQIIWNNGTVDIGWHYHEKKLERYEGIYEAIWKSKITSVVAYNISNVFFAADYNNGAMVGIICTLILNNQEKPIISYVAVKNTKGT